MIEFLVQCLLSPFGLLALWLGVAVAGAFIGFLIGSPRMLYLYLRYGITWKELQLIDILQPGEDALVDARKATR